MGRVGALALARDAHAARLRIGPRLGCQLPLLAARGWGTPQEESERESGRNASPNHHPPHLLSRPLHPPRQPTAPPAAPSPKRTPRPRPRGTTTIASLGPRAALASLTVWLDASLVTHPTGHALLPALAAAGLPHAVSRDPHPLADALSVRTVLFSRGGGGGGRERETDANKSSSSSSRVPFVLACLTASDYVSAVDAGTGLEALAIATATAHPGATLGVVVEGLDAHLSSRERADARAGVAPSQGGFVRRRYDGADAAVAIRLPGVRLTLVPDAVAAAEHAVGLAKALAVQPFKKRGDFVTDFDGDSAAARTLLASVTGESRPVIVAARALARVPGVGPSAALAVARQWGCLGALMQAATDDATTLTTTIAGLRAGRARVGPATAARVVAMLTVDDGDAVVE